MKKIWHLSDIVLIQKIFHSDKVYILYYAITKPYVFEFENHFDEI